jgi:hypothetical protein
MKKIYILLLALAGLMFVLPKPGHSIPAFARKHGFNCNMCHTAYTKLNDYGQRVRDNGYQIPGQEGLEKNVFQTSPPLSMRTTTGISTYNVSKGSTTGFNIYGLDLLAAGVLHKNISFLLIYTPRIDEPAADYRGSYNGSNPVQLASVESANLVFSNIVPSAPSARIISFNLTRYMFSERVPTISFSMTTRSEWKPPDISETDSNTD